MTGVQFLEGATVGFFPLHHRIQTVSGGHSASYPMDTGGKAAGREADRSLLSSDQIKNAWSYTSSPQYVFMSC
jgi:hypothetical protein